MPTIAVHLEAAAEHLEQARLLAGQRRDGPGVQGEYWFELWAQIGGLTATVERILREARKGEKDGTHTGTVGG